MHLLFIGNANSFLLINLSLKLKEYYPDITIDIISDSRVDSTQPSLTFNKIYAVDSRSRWSKIKFIKVLWYAIQYYKLLKKIKRKYDAVHLFYLSANYRLVWSSIKKIGKKTIITVFGSEFYRSNFLIKFMQRKMVRDAQIITASNEITLHQFSFFFDVPKEKQRLCRFGLSILDEIETVTEQDIIAFKAKHADNAKRLIIACGYNASPNQNLERIIDQINAIKEQLPEFVLFFQLPGHDPQPYREKVIQQLQETDIQFKIFTEVFSNKDLAIYRKSCNIFIQVQNTDQLSGAMQEFLFAGANVITGAWLPYKVLDDLKTDYVKINHLDEIGKALVKNIGRKINKTHNSAVIQKLSGWKNTIDDWRSLY